MDVTLVDESPPCLRDYATVTSALVVSERVDVALLEGGICGGRIRGRAVERPFVKDYDALAGQHPEQWGRRWDLTSGWWFGGAFVGKKRVGGVAVALDVRQVEGSGVAGDEGVALLWDVRVSPEFRRQGVGRKLIELAEERARCRGVRRMRVETQDVNVAACRFYARGGYRLVAINRGAYAELPEEVQLIWEKGLVRADSRSS